MIGRTNPIRMPSRNRSRERTSGNAAAASNEILVRGAHVLDPRSELEEERDILIRGVDAEDGAGRIARQQAHQEEDHDHDQEEGRQDLQQPDDDVVQAQCSYSRSVPETAAAAPPDRRVIRRRRHDGWAEAYFST